MLYIHNYLPAVPKMKKQMASTTLLPLITQGLVSMYMIQKWKQEVVNGEQNYIIKRHFYNTIYLLFL